MAADEKWYFTKEQLQDTPSRRCGFDADKELSYRQQAANFIQDMGQKLQVSQLCINTAIVYMHRFYMFHSFTHFPWNTIAGASFFLAAKVEEQPRKLEHVIRIANHCLNRDQASTFDAKSEQYAAQSQDLVFNENVLLQTLGFDVAIDHPHTHVVRCCHLVRASKDLAQTSYFMASNSLHLTTMCLQYKPTVVACFCIHLACKWSNWQIPKSNEGKDWFYYVDKSVTSELLEQLTGEFLKIYEKCPSRLKRKITSISTINQNHGHMHSIEQLHASSSNSPFDPDSRKRNLEKEGGSGPTFHSRSHHEAKPGLLATPEDPHKKSQRPHDPSSSQQQQRADYREYREKKERERLEREKAAQHHKSGVPGAIPNAGGGKHMPPTGLPPNVKPSHHRPPPAGVDPAKMKMHHRPSDMSRESLSHGREHGSMGSSKEQPALSREMANGRDGRDRERDRERERDHRGDVQKQRAEYLVQQRSSEGKPEAPGTDITAKVDSSVVSDKCRYDANRQKVTDAKLPLKQHDPNKHRRDVSDPGAKYAKQPTVGSSVGGAINANSGSSISEVLNKTSKPVVVPNAQDKSNVYMNKQINSTSQRHKSPFVDTPKSVPAPSATHALPKTDARNGNHGAMQQPPPPPPLQQQPQPQTQPQPQLQQLQTDGNKVWQTSASSTADTQQSSNVDDISGLLSPPLALPKKTSSLFSPEKSPPHKKSWNTKTPPSTGKRTSDALQLPNTQNTVPPALSPFGSPPAVPKIPAPTSLRRPRTSSSGSEPELRPVVKKLDQISGFENIIRDSKMGIKLPKVPDIIQPICDRTQDAPAETSISKELKPPDIIKPFNTTNSDASLAQPLVNGIETDPAVISTLLKEAAPLSNHLSEDTKPVVSTAEMPTSSTTVASVPLPPAVPAVVEGEKHKSEHHHKSEKKKKKDKHKHKDKEKSRDEKKKKHKDKDKERHKSKSEKNEPDIEVPLKITISKDKLQPVVEPSVVSGSTGLKVKISKDRLKSDVIAEPPPPPAPSTLKIKISKDQIQYNSVVDANASSNSSSSSRKRERDKASPSMATPPPTKAPKTSYNGGRDSSRQNGRSSYNKVAQMGDGEASQLKLAESKYHSKGASKTS